MTGPILTAAAARYDTARKEGKAVGGSRRQQQDRGGAKRGGGSSKSELFEQDLDEGELQRLVRDAQAAFGSRRVFLASDYYTFKVRGTGVVPQNSALLMQVEVHWAWADWSRWGVVDSLLACLLACVKRKDFSVAKAIASL